MLVRALVGRLVFLGTIGLLLNKIKKMPVQMWKDEYSLTRTLARQLAFCSVIVLFYLPILNFDNLTIKQA